jgi:hypothetical protein
MTSIDAVFDDLCASVATTSDLTTDPYAASGRHKGYIWIV